MPSKIRILCYGSSAAERTPQKTTEGKFLWHFGCDETNLQNLGTNLKLNCDVSFLWYYLFLWHHTDYYDTLLRCDEYIRNQLMLSTYSEAFGQRCGAVAFSNMDPASTNSFRWFNLICVSTEMLLIPVQWHRREILTVSDDAHSSSDTLLTMWSMDILPLVYTSSRKPLAILSSRSESCSCCSFCSLLSTRSLPGGTTHTL